MRTTNDADLAKKIVGGWFGRAMEIVLHEDGCHDGWQGVGDRLLLDTLFKYEVKGLHHPSSS